MTTADEETYLQSVCHAQESHNLAVCKVPPIQGNVRAPDRAVNNLRSRCVGLRHTFADINAWRHGVVAADTRRGSAPGARTCG